jgi:hypothetical protein
MEDDLKLLIVDITANFTLLLERMAQVGAGAAKA